MIIGKCDYCDSPIKSGEKFCHSCGAANRMYVPDDEKAFNAQYAIAQENTKMATIIIVGMVVFCVVLCAAVFGIFMIAGV